MATDYTNYVINAAIAFLMIKLVFVHDFGKRFEVPGVQDVRMPQGVFTFIAFLILIIPYMMIAFLRHRDRTIVFSLYQVVILTILVIWARFQSSKQNPRMGLKARTQDCLDRISTLTLQKK